MIMVKLMVNSHVPVVMGRVLCQLHYREGVKRRKMNNKNFIYQGYSIPKSFILKLKYKKGLDAYTIDRLIFWAVQYCDYKKGSVSLIQAMQSGITKGWLFKLIGSELQDKKYIEWWIDREIYGRKKIVKKGGFAPAIDRQKAPDSIGDVLKEIGV